MHLFSKAGEMWNMSSHEAKRPCHSFLCLGYKLSGISHMRFPMSAEEPPSFCVLGGSSAFVILMPKRSWPGTVAGVSTIFFSCRCWELAGSRTKFYWVLDLVRPSLRLEHIRSLFFWVENVTGIGDWLLHDCIGLLEWLYQSILNHFDEKLFSTHLGWIVAPYLFFYRSFLDAHIKHIGDVQEEAA